MIQEKRAASFSAPAAASAAPEPEATQVSLAAVKSMYVSMVLPALLRVHSMAPEGLAPQAERSLAAVALAVLEKVRGKPFIPGVQQCGHKQAPSKELVTMLEAMDKVLADLELLKKSTGAQRDVSSVSRRKGGISSRIEPRDSVDEPLTDVGISMDDLRIH